MLTVLFLVLTIVCALLYKKTDNDFFGFFGLLNFILFGASLIMLMLAPMIISQQLQEYQKTLTIYHSLDAEKTPEYIKSHLFLELVAQEINLSQEREANKSFWLDWYISDEINNYNSVGKVSEQYIVK
jgi:hypothetical protein